MQDIIKPLAFIIFDIHNYITWNYFSEISSYIDSIYVFYEELILWFLEKLLLLMKYN